MSAPNSPGGFNSVSASKSVGDHQQRAGRMRLLGEVGIIIDRAVRVGILHQRAKNLFVESKTSRGCPTTTSIPSGVRACWTTSMVCG